MKQTMRLHELHSSDTAVQLVEGKVQLTPFSTSHPCISIRVLRRYRPDTRVELMAAAAPFAPNWCAALPRTKRRIAA